MKRVCLYGPESTGKSTLAAALAAHYRTTWAPEFLRGYWDAKGGVIGPEDMPLIAAGQARALEEAALTGHRVVFADTDVLTSQLYHEFYYGTSPAWYEPLIARQGIALYLLCHPDVPWEADGQRDMPHRRAELFALFQAKLDARGLPYAPVTGLGEGRLRAAIAAVDALLDG